MVSGTDRVVLPPVDPVLLAEESVHVDEQPCRHDGPHVAAQLGDRVAELTSDDIFGAPDDSRMHRLGRHHRCVASNVRRDDAQARAVEGRRDRWIDQARQVGYRWIDVQDRSVGTQPLGHVAIGEFDRVPAIGRTEDDRVLPLRRHRRVDRSTSGLHRHGGSASWSVGIECSSAWRACCHKAAASPRYTKTIAEYMLNDNRSYVVAATAPAAPAAASI